MNVSELLSGLPRMACVRVNTVNGAQLLFDGSKEDFSKIGYTADACNTMELDEVMSLAVRNYFTPKECKSLVIETAFG